MRFFKLSIVLAGIAVFAVGCATGGPGPSANNSVANKMAAPVNTASNVNQPSLQSLTDDLSAARAVYKENCADCHRDGGQGGQAMFNGKPVKVPDFKKPSALKASDEDFIDQVTDGSDEMPAFKKKLSPEQIKDQVKLIRSLQQSGGGA
jgi:mono/diheme cytochrome c family protein